MSNVIAELVRYVIPEGDVGLQLRLLRCRGDARSEQTGITTRVVGAKYADLGLDLIDRTPTVDCPRVGKELLALRTELSNVQRRGKGIAVTSAFWPGPDRFACP